MDALVRYLILIRRSLIVAFLVAPAVALVGCGSLSAPQHRPGSVNVLQYCQENGYPTVVLGSEATSCRDDLCVSGPACANFDVGSYMLWDGATITCQGGKEFEGPLEVTGVPPSAC